MGLNTIDPSLSKKIVKNNLSLARKCEMHISVEDRTVELTVPGKEYDQIYVIPKQEVKDFLQKMFME